jgi:hypothetical protein
MSSESFNSGAVRGSQTGKGRYDLISTHATRALAMVLEEGATKYGDRNWEKGIPIMRHLSSCKRHIDQFIERQVEEVDPATSTYKPINHLHNAYANLMMAIHTMVGIHSGDLDPCLDDRPVPFATGDEVPF